ncbi:hypothetical protein [Holdemania filiformis]|uniref:hypothetical protein n=1 Tax=Holdemania filiformis TaxID=61171 RepID=UPI003A8E0AD0
MFRWLRLLNRLKSSRNPPSVDFSVSSKTGVLKDAGLFHFPRLLLIQKSGGWPLLFSIPAG